MSVVSGTVLQKVELSQTKSGVPSPYGMDAKSGMITRSYGNGTGAGAIDLLHCKSYSLAAAATTIDLTALADLESVNQNYARVREFYIRNTSAYPLFVGNAAATQWAVAQGPIVSATATFCVLPGGTFQWSDYSTVGASLGAYVDSTHKSLKFDPGANTVTFDLIIAGCSAVS